MVIESRQISVGQIGLRSHPGLLDVSILDT